jgi:hypothetical protein
MGQTRGHAACHGAAGRLCRCRCAGGLLCRVAGGGGTLLKWRNLPKAQILLQPDSGAHGAAGWLASEPLARAMRRFLVRPKRRALYSSIAVAHL